MYTGNPDDDLKSGHQSLKMYRDLKNPQNTYFKKLVSQQVPTHFRCWLKTIKSDSNIVQIDKKDYIHINAIANLLVIVKFPRFTIHYDEVFKRIQKVTFKIGDKTIIELDGWAVLELLKKHPDLYEKTMNTFNNGNINYKISELAIPLQYFMMDKNHLITNSFDDSIYIAVESSIEGYKIDCSFECIKFTKEEYKRYNFSASETYISTYYIKKYKLTEDVLEIPLNMPIMIRDITLFTYQDISANFDGIDLLKGDETVLNYYNIVVPSDCSYYYNYSPLMNNKGLDNLSNPTTGFTFGDKDKKLTVILNKRMKASPTDCVLTEDYDDVYLIIRHDNILANPDRKPAFVCKPHEVKPNYDNFYPLTKNKNGTFIEGYWYSDGLYEEQLHSYPFPKATNLPVDKNFIEKLKRLTIGCLDCTHYFGCSHCRICGKSNGSSEFKLINKENIIFNYPEGLMHYYEEHNVQPSKEFYDFIMDF